MTIPSDEASALRRCVAILAPVSTPSERATMALNLEKRISGKSSSMLAFRFTHFGHLFFPGDAQMASRVTHAIQAAIVEGSFVTRVPAEHRGATLAEIVAWPERPSMAADSPLRYWIPDAVIDGGASHHGGTEPFLSQVKPWNAENQAVTFPAPAAAAQGKPKATSNAAGWVVHEPKRFGGYSYPLFKFLTAACRAEERLPSARDVLEAWRVENPGEVAKVLSDSIDYYDGNGNTKTANIGAISKSIKRMTSNR